jgi:peptidoglycan/LPS O-acetylase OafA/YrhL
VLVVVAILTGCYGLLLLTIAGRLRLGRARWLAAAGSLTYPIYLLHHNMGYLMLQHLGRHLDKHVLLVTILVALLVVAWLLHVFVERPFSKKLGEKVS